MRIFKKNLTMLQAVGLKGNYEMTSIYRGSGDILRTTFFKNSMNVHF